jgi:hypothetical protein
MRKWLRHTSRFGAALIAVWVIHALCASWYWQITVGRPIEREFGFRIGTPIIQEEGKSWPSEVVSVDSLRWDGILVRAGFREGDIIRGLSVSEVYKVLHRGRGKQVTLEAVDGGDGLPINQRKVRAIAINIPRGRESQ